MLNIKLNSMTQKNISICVGKPFNNITTLSPDEEEKLIGNNVNFSKKRNPRRIGRGNPLLSRRNFRTLEEVENKLKEIK
ncbi:MAG: hypothetical protein NC320_01995 [Clostridium sp.]|nr:hypothetical protein [Clostridium sp.]